MIKRSHSRGLDHVFNRAKSVTIICLFIGLTQLSVEANETGERIVVSKIALGSCANEDREQPIWGPIVDQDPDLFLFLGDNVYADTEDMKEMEAAYDLLAAKPGYQKLLKTCPVLAVWDGADRDIGNTLTGDVGNTFCEYSSVRIRRKLSSRDARRRP